MIAHRGGHGLAPENTLAALDVSRGLGVEEVEVDVRMSRDGGLVLFHDGGLARKTGTAGSVASQDLAALLQLEVGRWYDRTHPVGRRFEGTRIASLDQALAAFGQDFLWHLELKSGEESLAPAVLATVERMGLGDRVTLSSFRVGQLEQARALAPGIPLCLLVGPSEREGALTPEEGVTLAAERGFAMVGIAAPDVTEDLVRRCAPARCRRAGLRHPGPIQRSRE